MEHPKEYINKPTANIQLSGKEVKDFPKRSGIGQDAHSHQSCSSVLPRLTRQVKEIKASALEPMKLHCPIRL